MVKLADKQEPVPYTGARRKEKRYWEPGQEKTTGQDEFEHVLK